MTFEVGLAGFIKVEGMGQPNLSCGFFNFAIPSAILASNSEKVFGS